MQQPHILLSSDQVSELVVLCGEPARVDRISAHLENATLLADNREFRSMSGSFAGKTITVCSTGIGAPSAIIALEELRQCGATQFIRIGSAGALQPKIALGELILVDGAVRDDGGSSSHAPLAYPAIADRHLTCAMETYLTEHNVTFHSGIVRSHDSFYRDDEMEVCKRWHHMGVLGADMETAALMTLGRIKGLKVGAVLNNVVLYGNDVQEGINDYVCSDDALMRGEKMAIRCALHGLTS
ncbi:nucleoside phosphorylase [Ferrimonas aestuarii]|uniref:Uridine phosphorylase n=1 Tax=Ferrimonas aestuarii TaxID=2569539 RepID=A0A4U1BT43_9GAMM|nr:nucleoside phosphorylase [Ferrimonas aestuarii]TKB58342.1 nucleoside phosphorylase [Ferrimonas aestuarii]